MAQMLGADEACDQSVYVYSAGTTGVSNDADESYQTDFLETCQSGLSYLFAKEVEALNPPDGSNPSVSARNPFSSYKSFKTFL